MDPYAAPKANLIAEPNTGEDGASFYTVGLPKLYILSMCTFNLYHLVFWWRHWKRIKQGGANISPFWRTVFSPLMFFDFRTRVRTELIAQDVPVAAALSWAPALYLLLNVVDRVVARADAVGIGMFALTVGTTLLSTWTLAVTQGAINALHTANGGVVQDTRPSAGAVVFVLLGLVFWGLAAVGYLVPLD